MYKVKEQFKLSMVRLTDPGKFGTKINLAVATQEELEFLYNLGHVAVIKVEKKEKE